MNLEKTYRDQYMMFFNTSNTKDEKQWDLEGTGVDSLSISYNPQIDTFKEIIARNSTNEFNGYQLQSSVSGKRIKRGDPIYEFINKNARRKGDAIYTEALEVDMAHKEGNAYEAIQYNVMIVITEFLGEEATIGYDIYINGDWDLGTVSIADGKPTFTESADI